jgi:hypothetical protein
MTESQISSSPRPTPDTGGRVGLRARIWVGTLGAAVATAAGLSWVYLDQTAPGADLGAFRLAASLGAVAGAALLTGLLCAVWLDRGVLRQLRGLIRGMRTGRVTELRGLPASGGWGELSQLTEQVQLLLAYQRQALQAAEELGAMRRQLAALQSGVQGWLDTERWTTLPAEAGVFQPLAGQLNQAVERLEELSGQHGEVALQVRDDLAGVHEEVRSGSEQAERGFVEATALLTTVRELQRLSAELEQALQATRPEDETAGDAAWRVACREAIEELVQASAQSVEHLAQGLSRVEDISEQVQVLSNRATLVALNVALVVTRSGEADAYLAELPAEMKALTQEVRSGADRMADLSRSVRSEVRTATERMKQVRTRVAARLDAVPEGRGRGPTDEASRLLERVREMVQDAGQKGERMVAVAERTSRAAERSLRALEESVGGLDGLLVRLAAEKPRAAAPAAELRLLTPSDAQPLGDDGGARREEAP